MNTWRWVLMMALGFAGVARADLEGTYKTITLDGSLADWDSGDVLYDDAEIADGDPENSSYANVYVANNDVNLFIGLETKGSGGGDIFNTYTRNIYIDADMDGDTGFDSGWMTGGYDYLVQYGAGGGVYSVFAFTGGDQTAWSWNFVDTIAYSYGDSAIELAIPLAQVGLSGGDSARIEFHVTGAGVNTETWAHQSEASVETYTVAVVPEPGTALLIGGGLAALGMMRRRARTA
ncbi:MAG TPA: PEP-CTERM sorting domain-containing protein [Kiritimatiellia bacterium]|nr:PEP-CTERM sorting domain-containing protein [Kiritimatiellia bacterium]